MHPNTVVVLGRPYLISDDRLDCTARQWLDHLAQYVPCNEHFVIVMTKTDHIVAKIEIEQRQVCIYGQVDATQAEKIAIDAIWGFYGSFFKTCPPAPIIGRAPLDSDKHIYWAPCCSNG